MKHNTEATATDSTLPSTPNLKNPYFRMRARKISDDYKTTILVDPNGVVPEGCPDSVLENLRDSLDEQLEKIPGHREVAKYGPDADTPKKRPASVFTPDGTELHSVKRYELLIVYEEHKILEKTRSIHYPDDDIAAAALKSPSKGIKYQTIEITPEEVTDRIKYKVVRGTNRTPDQQTTIVRDGLQKNEASATKIAQDTEIAADDSEVWEWLHLIEFLLCRKQHPSNLVAGTAYANTDQMTGEYAFKKLAFLLNEKIKLEVKTDIPDTNFPTKIEFIITTSAFPIHLTYNTRTSINPNSRTLPYFDAVIVSLVKDLKDLKSLPASKSLNFSEDYTIEDYTKASLTFLPLKKKPKIVNNGPIPPVNTLEQKK